MLTPMFHLKIWEEKGETQPRRTASRCQPSPRDSHTDQTAPRAVLSQACSQPLPLSGVSNTESSREFYHIHYTPGKFSAIPYKRNLLKSLDFHENQSERGEKQEASHSEVKKKIPINPFFWKAKQRHRDSPSAGAPQHSWNPALTPGEAFTTDTRVLPQQGEQAVSLPRFLPLIWF